MNQTDDRKICDLCNRKFAQDRLEKHIEICRRQKEKKRNVFDSYKQRQIIDSNDEINGITNMNEKSANVPSKKSKTRIVKPVSRPTAKKLINKQINKTDELNGEVKNTITNGTMDNGTNKNSSDKTSNNHNSETNTEDQNNKKNTNNKKSQWRENHEEFVRTMQATKKMTNGNGIDSLSDDQMHNKQNGNESIDKESTITTNSEKSNSTTTSTNASAHTTTSTTATINTATNGRSINDEEKTQIEKPKPAPRKIQPPQSRLNKMNKLNQVNGQQLNNKQVNSQIMMNGSTVSGASTIHTNQNSTTAMNKKSVNNSVECSTCGRTFNRAAGERHIPFCREKERQRKSSNNNTNEEALARFRARNAYRSNKGVKKRDKSVPNEKKEKYVRQSSLRRALSTIDGLDEVFKNKEQITNSNNNLTRKRSTSQGNLNRTTPKYNSRDQSIKKLQVTNHSKSSSASSKGSAQNYNNHHSSTSMSYRETAQSRVKARLNQQQKLQKQRMNSNYPKTPIMKFKEKFPNHNNKLIEFSGSQQFTQMFKKHLNNSIELNNSPKTVPGVRTGGLSPTKDIYRNGHHLEDLNDLEQLRAKIKEMYLSSNGNNLQGGDLINLDYHLAGNDFNENSFTRENSSKIKSSKSVNDFLSINDGFNDHLINDIELPKLCHQCSTDYITSSARYCYVCGSRRLGTVNSYLV